MCTSVAVKQFNAINDSIDKPDDIDFIESEIHNIKKTDHVVSQPKTAHVKTVDNKKVQVLSSYELARNNLKRDKRIHRHQIKQLKASVKYQKLSLRHKKLSYKLVVNSLNWRNRVRLALHMKIKKQ